jgi:inhibitor of KinA sporulation pathway (predicted exonuclease)
VDEDFDRFLNVVDVEATCWPACPPAGESSGIIQFATAFGLRLGVGMSRALIRAGRPLHGRRHRGGGDAWIVAALVRLGQPVTG